MTGLQWASGSSLSMTPSEAMALKSLGMCQSPDARESGAVLGSVELWLAIVAILALLLALGWWLSFTAVRLDRLHTRNEATEAALDAQVVRRAEAAVEDAYSGELNPASAELLLDAATHALQQQGSGRRNAAMPNLSSPTCSPWLLTLLALR
ncbi:hypothetical protein [Ornithinimicrobium sp. INDO-MA30-4]|uniref:hypothetical protein n=1 Tax=Ornithinimicrobium sp. INDO-MA30-4 TaxID=2908651 RepID=UPI001F3306B8|nr:hypothetical protein [Ornithinimicrobium sp. INDO-MA30-4]UJH71164.1 hypothetical protein L0A91_04800 [Ornithinimicrobium sp. INDO-MA30-4]